MIVIFDFGFRAKSENMIRILTSHISEVQSHLTLLDEPEKGQSFNHIYTDPTPLTFIGLLKPYCWIPESLTIST